MDLDHRLNYLEVLVRNLVRVGKVVKRNPEKATVAVEIKDAEELITWDLPVLYRKTKNDKDYYMPDIDEQVVCIFLGNGIEVGFVIGAFYSSCNLTPTDCPNKQLMTFSDGTSIEYDRKQHKLTLDIQGQLSVTTTSDMQFISKGNMSFTADTIMMNGNSGDVVVDKVSLVNHVNTNVTPGPSVTGPPAKG